MVTLLRETKLTPHEIRSIAVRALVDPRTVKAKLEGNRKLHPSTEAAIERAMIELGFTTKESE